jgi:hypothetical protein
MSVTIGLWVLTILISGTLYRIPRGGGLGPGKSFEGALIWALTSALLMWVTLSALNWWMIPVIVVLMMFGEAPGWSQWWPNSPTASKVRLSLRGMLLLNPLMGPIYFYFYEQRERLPLNSGFFDGWTGWSEIVSGMVTITGYLILFSFYKEEYVYTWIIKPLQSSFLMF